jgi:hypothetical protein
MFSASNRAARRASLTPRGHLVQRSAGLVVIAVDLVLAAMIVTGVFPPPAAAGVSEPPRGSSGPLNIRPLDGLQLPTLGLDD